ncbi:hypothetical protein GCM10007298_03980 [Williamsia phyllosphaerae]|uniref:Uncharacterized protein n=1 Tax=Williamsia phyllosphaerae TaxID=885042 RepID=A0ABQ1U9K2_9NOCA|nr:hypothetical protein GCM10007298_03980 [Williamsia phyllosphaerae]
MSEPQKSTVSGTQGPTPRRWHALTHGRRNHGAVDTASSVEQDTSSTLRAISIWGCSIFTV